MRATEYGQRQMRGWGQGRMRRCRCCNRLTHSEQLESEMRMSFTSRGGHFEFIFLVATETQESITFRNDVDVKVHDKLAQHWPIYRAPKYQVAHRKTISV